MKYKYYERKVAVFDVNSVPGLAIRKGQVGDLGEETFEYVDWRGRRI